METKLYTLTDDSPGDNTEAALTHEERIEALIHDGIRLVLQHIGLDLSGNIDQQLEESQIILENRQDERDPLVRGVYILQKENREILPIAFVGNISTDLEKIQADIVMFNGKDLEC